MYTLMYRLPNIFNSVELGLNEVGRFYAVGGKPAFLVVRTCSTECVGVVFNRVRMLLLV